jgi:hypothetical protein
MEAQGTRDTDNMEYTMPQAVRLAEHRRARVTIRNSNPRARAHLRACGAHLTGLPRLNTPTIQVDQQICMDAEFEEAVEGPSQPGDLQLAAARAAAGNTSSPSMQSGGSTGGHSSGARRTSDTPASPMNMYEPIMGEKKSGLRCVGTHVRMRS